MNARSHLQSLSGGCLAAGGAIAALALVTVLRLLTLAHDPWEWDEVLFMEGVRDGIDVRVSHPHAPGYPAFIQSGRLLAAVGFSPFMATTLAGAFGGVASVGGVLFLLRTLGVSLPWALFGGVSYALIPSVWLHGVRPLSDGPATAAFLFGAAFLVRCVRESRARDFVLGGLFVALASAVRPQVGLSLLPVALVAGIHVVRRSGWRPLVVTILIGLGVELVFWIPAIRGSGGWTSFFECLRGQMSYLSRVDRPHIRDFRHGGFWQRWLLDSFGGVALGVIVWAAAALAPVFARRRSLLAIAIFSPITALSIGLLPVYAAPRYALAFLPLPCILLAITLEELAARRERLVVQVGAIGLLAALAIRAVPPVVEVHSFPSPSVALMMALRDDPGLRTRPVLYDGSLKVHVGEFLQKTRVTEIEPGEPAAPPPGGLIAAADDSYMGQLPIRVFEYRCRLLRLVSRGRYLKTQLYDGAHGAAYHVPRVTPPGWWDGVRKAAVLRPGAVLEVKSGRGPVTVTAVARALRGPGRVRLETDGGSVEMPLPLGESPVDFEATVDPKTLVSFRIACEAGVVELGHWSLVTLGQPVDKEIVTDDSIPAGIDDLPNGGKVAGPLVIRGWCQERGGGPVAPASFRIDGVLVVPVELTRVPRPDVPAAIPEIGDASHAGFVARFPPDVPGPGKHVLTVTFETPDSRRRVYPRLVFEISP